MSASLSQASSCGLEGLVHQGGVSGLLHDVTELLLRGPPLPVGMLQLGLGLLQLVPHGMSFPLGLDEMLPGLVALLLLPLEHHLGLPDLSLVLLDGLLGLAVGAISVL